MSRIIKGELFKVFSKKIVIFAAIFFTAIIFISTNYIPSTDGFTEYYNEYYRNHEGAVTEAQRDSAAEYLSKDHNISDDQSARIEAYRKYDYSIAVVNAFAYTNKSLEYRDALAEHNVSMAKIYGENSYEYRYGKLHAQMQNNTALPGLYFTTPLETPIDFPNNLGIVIISAMILLGVSPIFSQEYSSGTDSLILTSKKGKKELTGAKILACVIYSAVTGVYFCGVLFIFNAAKKGVMGFYSPIQAILKYNRSPFAFNLLQYYFLETAILIFAAICFGLLILFVSSISKSSIVPFFACGLVVAAPGAFKLLNLNLEDKVNHFLKCIFNFSYFELMRVSSLFTEFKAYNIFGYPVLSCFVIPITVLLITVVFTVLTFKTFKNHQVN